MSFILHEMLNRISTVQECDATGDAMNTETGIQNQLTKLKPFQKFCIKIAATETFVLH